jgi:hypothetical protein
MANARPSDVVDDTPHGLPMTQISHAIGLARITLIVGLIFLHYDTFVNAPVSPFYGLDPNNHPFVTWFNSAVLFFFFSAVPLLSMVSGWLFFSFMEKDAWHSIRRRMYRRFTSLYLPLVAWNLFYFLLIYAYYLKSPQAALFTHANRLYIDFAHAHWWNFIDKIFGITDAPIGFQFWFVRDLFVTALLTPLWWIMISRMPWLGAAMIAVIWVSGWNMYIFVRPDVPFFFYLGALIKQKHIRMTIPLKVTIALMVLYITLACLRALAPLVVPIDASPHMNFCLDAATRLMRIPGVIACWGLIYRAAVTPRGIALSNYGGVAFFLHSVHWPMLSVIKTVIWKFMPGDSGFWMLVHYALSVSSTIAIGIGSGLLLARFAPRFFALMNGGRLLGQFKNIPVSPPLNAS